MSVLAVDVRASRVSQAGDPFRLRVAFEGQAGITVVCGSSGAGKSSLLLAILGALRGTTGRITLGDRTLLDSARDRKLPVRERRLGMVFQNAPLFPHLDVLRNVAFGIRGGESLRQARRLLERVGARDLERRRTDELSGGLSQRDCRGTRAPVVSRPPNEGTEYQPGHPGRRAGVQRETPPGSGKGSVRSSSTHSNRA